jgi:hypothetical protein
MNGYSQEAKSRQCATPPKQDTVIATQLAKIRGLSVNGLRDIVLAEKGSKTKSAHFVLQVIEVKQFSPSDNKKHMRQR